MRRLPEIDINPADIDWKGLPERFMNPGELERLVTLARSTQPRVMVEIGVNEGRTAKAMLRELPTITKYIGIDVMPDYMPSKPVQRDEVPKHPGKLVADNHRFKLFVLPRGSLGIVPADLPRNIDVVFIDGDHSRMVVEHDTLLARQVVRPGGLIIWHDYHDLGTVDVAEVLHDFHDAGRTIFHAKDTWLAFERL